MPTFYCSNWAGKYVLCNLGEPVTCNDLSLDGICEQKKAVLESGIEYCNTSAC